MALPLQYYEKVMRKTKVNKILTQNQMNLRVSASF